MLRDIGDRGVEQTFCLGDLVGYGPDPNGVIELIRSEGIPTIAGNYDDGTAFARGDCGCYYADAEARRIGEASYGFTVRVLTEANKAWLRSLPRERRLEVGGRRLHLVHGSPRKINEYLQRDRDERTFRRIAESERSGADVLVFGHTHTPWFREYDGVLFVNAGSVGRPKDADTRAAYVILDLIAGRPPAVEVVRVAYDVERTATAIEAAGLPAALAAAFREGR